MDKCVLTNKDVEDIGWECLFDGSVKSRVLYIAELLMYC